MEILNRKQAYSLGKNKYFTGKSCIRGHQSFRYVNTGVCVDCAAGYSRRYQSKFLSSPKRQMTEVKISLLSKEDESALRAYAQALNFQRELNEISNGKL